MTKELAELEVKRVRLHDYVIMKLEERDYHGVADAAMDLRELEVTIKLYSKLWEYQNQTANAKIKLEIPKGLVDKSTT